MTETQSGNSSYIASIAQQSLLYGIGIFGRQALIYLTLPLFTNRMSPNEFGVISVMTAFMSLIDVISNAGLPAATFRLYNDTDDAKIQRQVLGSSFLLFMGYAVIIMFATIIAARPLSFWLFNGSSDYKSIVVMVAILMAILTAVNFGYILLRIQVKPLTVSLHIFLQTLAQIGFSLIFVVLFNGHSVEGYWMGQFLGAILGLGFILWLTRKNLHFLISMPKLTELSLYALPLIPETVGFWALRMLDRILISFLAGFSQVGVYEVAYKLAMISSLLILPFRTAWPQFAYSIARREDAPSVYSNLLTYVVLLSLFPMLAVYAFAPELLSFLAPSSYGDARGMILWLLMAQFVSNVYIVLVVGLHISKKTIWIAVITLMSTVLDIVLIFLLTPSLGAQGAAMAIFFSYLFLAVSARFFSRKHYYYPVDWKKIGGLTISSATAIALIWLAQFSGNWLGGFSLRFFSMIAFIVLLFALRVFTISQLKEFAVLLKKAFRPSALGPANESNS